MITSKLNKRCIKIRVNKLKQIIKIWKRLVMIRIWGVQRIYLICQQNSKIRLIKPITNKFQISKKKPWKLAVQLKKDKIKVYMICSLAAKINISAKIHIIHHQIPETHHSKIKILRDLLIRRWVWVSFIYIYKISCRVIAENMRGDRLWRMWEVMVKTILKINIRKLRVMKIREEKLENREALSIWKLKWIKMIVFPRIIFMKRLRIILWCLTVIIVTVEMVVFYFYLQVWSANNIHNRHNNFRIIMIMTSFC